MTENEIGIIAVIYAVELRCVSRLARDQVFRFHTIF